MIAYKWCLSALIFVVSISGVAVHSIIESSPVVARSSSRFVNPYINHVLQHYAGRPYLQARGGLKQWIGNWIDRLRGKQQSPLKTIVFSKEDLEKRAAQQVYAKQPGFAGQRLGLSGKEQSEALERFREDIANKVEKIHQIRSDSSVKSVENLSKKPQKSRKKLKVEEMIKELKTEKGSR